MATGGSDHTNGYKILLMNTAGSRRGKSKVSNACRQNALHKILEELKPSIVFTQECASGIHPRYPYSEDYMKIGGKESGYIFNTEEFYCCELSIDPQTESMKTCLQNYFTKVNKSNNYWQEFAKRHCKNDSALKAEDVLAQRFVERVCMAYFQSRCESNFRMLAVSWHGPHSSWTDDDKLVLLDYMFFFLRNLRSFTDSPNWNGKHPTIIIGGDFNLTADRAIPKIQQDGFHLQQYKNGPIRGARDQLDYFVSSPGLIMSDVNPYIIPGYKKMISANKISLSDFISQWRTDKVGFAGSPDAVTISPSYTSNGEVFDHDPIQATIFLQMTSYSSNVTDMRRAGQSEEDLVQLVQHFDQFGLQQQTQLNHPVKTPWLNNQSYHPISQPANGPPPQQMLRKFPTTSANSLDQYDLSQISTICDSATSWADRVKSKPNTEGNEKPRSFSDTLANRKLSHSNFGYVKSKKYGVAGRRSHYSASRGRRPPGVSVPPLRSVKQLRGSAQSLNSDRSSECKDSDEFVMGRSEFLNRKKREMNRCRARITAKAKCHDNPEPARDVIVFKYKGTLESIEEYVKEQKINVRAVEMITSHPKAACCTFKVTGHGESDFQKLVCKDTWPEGVIVKKYVSPRDRERKGQI